MHDPIMVTRSSMPGLEEYVEEIRDIWDSRWLTNMGPKHKALQEALCRYLDLPRIDLLTNGHTAIELGLLALDLPEGSEVITTPFTFASTTQAIVRCGLKPVFCDVDPTDFTLDPEKLLRLITPRTSAIVPVHVYGNVCRVEELERIAREHGLKILYDAAHTFGVRYKGRGIGNYGDAACFSFHATKVFHTIEGGGITFRDEAAMEKLARLKNFGIAGPDEVTEVGANGKMNEFCAAMGLCNLRHVDGDIAKRKAVVEQYNEILEGVPGLQLNPKQPDVQPNYAYYPVVVDPAVFGTDRDGVLEALARENVNGRKYFYPTTNSFACYGGAYDPEQTPIALELSRRVLTLPLYADLSVEDAAWIAGLVRAAGR